MIKKALWFLSLGLYTIWIGVVIGILSYALPVSTNRFAVFSLIGLVPPLIYSGYKLWKNL